MRIYTIHMPPPYTAREDGPIAIREGFNFWAFLFTGFWAFANRMWLLGVGLLAIGAALGLVLRLGLGLSEEGEAVISLAYMYLVGCHANDLKREHLARRGWRTAGVVAAADEDSAIRRYFDLKTLGSIG